MQELPTPFVLSLSKDETSNLFFVLQHRTRRETARTVLFNPKVITTYTANNVKEPALKKRRYRCIPRTNPTLQAQIHRDI
jgi:hypothetical protein